MLFTPLRNTLFSKCFKYIDCPKDITPFLLPLMLLLPHLFFFFSDHLPLVQPLPGVNSAPSSPYLVDSSSHGDGSPSKTSTATLQFQHFLCQSISPHPFNCLSTSPRLPPKQIWLPFSQFAPSKLPSQHFSNNLSLIILFWWQFVVSLDGIRSETPNLTALIPTLIRF